MTDYKDILEEVKNAEGVTDPEELAAGHPGTRSTKAHRATKSGRAKYSEPIKRGTPVIILTGKGAGVKGIVTHIEGDRATVINLMRGTFIISLGDIEAVRTERED